MDQTSVVLADDNTRVRAGIRSLLDSAPDIVVVGEASDGVEALSAVAGLSPDVLVLDIEMPRMNGIQVTQELHTVGSQVQILVLSAHNDWQFIRSMLENGAAGYLVKDEVPEILLRAVRGIARGEHGWFSSQIAALIAAGLSQTGPDQPTLTQRELEILRLLVGRHTLEEISRRLNLPQHLVDYHIEILSKKLGVGPPDDLDADVLYKRLFQI